MSVVKINTMEKDKHISLTEVVDIQPPNDPCPKNKRLCHYDNCILRASYGLKNAKRPTHCKKHALQNMIAHDNRRCQHVGCSKRPNFGYPNANKPTHCNIHKHVDMVTTDSRKCSFKSCPHRARYGYNNQKPRACLKHKEPDMINVTRQGCMHESCSKYPCYGYEGDPKPTYCVHHKKENMINIKQKRCTTHMCYGYCYNPMNKGLCNRCFIYTYPDAVKSKKYKTKENAVASFLRDNFSNVSFVMDKIVDGGCSRYRPDMMCDLLSHVIIVEVDEHQHCEYDKICENKRLVSLWTDLAHRPLVMIRFNPDAYDTALDITGCSKKNGSCFKYDSVRGIPYISKEKEWKKRLELLLQVINYYMDHIPTRSIICHELYYDGFSPSSMDWLEPSPTTS